MRRKGLTTRAVETIGDGWHHDGHGLYLQVTANGAGRSWVYRYAIDGKQRYIGLGPAHKHAIGLAQARELAQECRLQRLRGIDPLQAKHSRQDELRIANAKKVTFGQCVETFLEFKQPEWSNPKHAEQWAMTLRKYAKPLHPLSPDKIDLVLVVEALRPIWHKVPETASRTRQRIEAVLDHWAATNSVHGYVNPAAWERVKHALPSPAKIKKGSHYPALPFERMGEFMCDLREREGIAARALEFLILCCARTGDIIGQEREAKPPMLWKHVNLAERVWTIPSTKTETEHRVPLSDSAVKLLKEIKATASSDDVVFRLIGDSLSNMTMAAVIKRMNKNREIPERYTDPKQDNRDIVPHGFRSSFRDWASERTNHPNHVVEMALAHTIGDKVEAAYRRGDLFTKRAKLMDQWSQYCERPISSAVISFHRI